MVFGVGVDVSCVHVFEKVEWMSDLDVRSLGMVASRMLTNYIKSREREQMEKGEIASEEDEYFDPNYLEVCFVHTLDPETPAKTAQADAQAGRVQYVSTK